MSKMNLFKAFWRPAIATSYLAVCLFDFLIAPMLHMLLALKGIPYTPWSPITLQGGGMYHTVMMPFLSVYAWQRGQEKIKGVADHPTQ
jgi:hypothetical protein